jgi:hypothetical protein
MRMIFGAIGGMKIGRGNRSTRRKPTSAPLCPPQNPTWHSRPLCSDKKRDQTTAQEHSSRQVLTTGEVLAMNWGCDGSSAQSNYLVAIHNISMSLTFSRSRESALVIANGNRLDGGLAGYRVPIGARYFSSPRRPDRFGVHPAFYPLAGYSGRGMKLTTHPN